MSVTKVTSPMIESGTKGADIASAATVVIGTDGSYFDITGTTGISTQFTVDAGRRFTLQFDGAVTITDNAAITLSGAANFTTAAGDILSFVAVAANTVVQTGYSLVDGGSPVAAAGGEDGLTNSSNTTWMTVSADEEVNMPLQPCFLHNTSATADNENETGDGTEFTIQFNTQRFDIGGNTDANGVFTAPITGIYLFLIHLEVVNGSADHTSDTLTLDTGGVDPYSAHHYTTGGNDTLGIERMQASWIIQMTAGWTAAVKFTRGGGTKDTDMRGGSCWFSGALIA